MTTSSFREKHNVGDGDRDNLMLVFLSFSSLLLLLLVLQVGYDLSVGKVLRDEDKVRRVEENTTNFPI